MTSTIFVKRLNKTGVFSSGINTDAAFANEENPRGLLTSSFSLKQHTTATKSYIRKSRAAMNCHALQKLQK